MKKLIILDSFALIFRAYYAYPPTLTTKEGIQINAVYGFTNILLDILKKFEPEYIVAVFDSDKPTIRSTEFTQYKANRKETDASLISQIPIVQEVLKVFDIPVLKVDGYEADDVIGTIIEKMKDKPEIQKIILTGDQDIFQLIDNNTSVYLAGSKFSESKIYNDLDVYQKLKVYPNQIPLYKALAGDASDNIPGVVGIGPKTAIELIEKFGTLDNIYSNLNQIKSSVANKLIENYEMAQKSLRLATIDKFVPLHFDLSSTLLHSASIQKIKELFLRFQFNSLLKKIDNISHLFSKDSSLTINLIENNYEVQQKSVEVLDFESLKTLSTDTIFVDYTLEKSDVVPMDYKIFNLLVSNGNQVYKINKKDLNEFFEWIKTKTLVSFEIKSFLHVLVNLKRSDYIDEIKFHDLGFATHILSGGVYSKTISDIFIFNKIDKPPSTFLQAKLGFLIFQNLENELLNNKIYNLEIKILKVVLELERNGVKFNLDLADQYTSQLLKIKADLLQNIYNIVGFEFNLNSPKQVGSILFEKRGLTKVSKTKSGNYSTDESTLVKLRDLDPIVDLILQYRQIDKIYTTYVSTLPKYVHKDGRIYSTFDQIGTISGRFASKNPNLQNIPTGIKANLNIRNLFISEDGYEFISFDYSQQELRILAALAKEEKMIEAFNAGIDIHALTASQLYGVELGEVSKEQRNIGKIINFSVIYGVSSYGLSENLGLDVSLAGDLINKFYSNYPKLKIYFQKQKEFLMLNNFLETALGRRRNIVNFNNLNRFAQQAILRELLNFPIQGTAADLMKEAMIDINKIIKNYDAKLILQVHDEFLFEFSGDLEQKRLFIFQIKEVMQNVTNLGVNYKVDVKVGRKWGELYDFSF